MKENENNEENKIETKEKEEINVEEIQNEIKETVLKLDQRYQNISSFSCFIVGFNYHLNLRK